jgi:hypothetical protein
MTTQVLGAEPSAANDSPSKPAKSPLVNPDLDEETLYKQFEEMLSGKLMIGSFTTTGQEGQPLKEDKYTLEKVSRLENGLWQFVARIQYDGRDMKFPLALPVRWAGNTPVITIDKLVIPGMGAFSARVLFHDGQYAGTWSAGDHGGLMFGRIAPLEEETKEEQPKTESADQPKAKGK